MQCAATPFLTAQGRFLRIQLLQHARQIGAVSMAKMVNLRSREQTALLDGEGTAVIRENAVPPLRESGND